MDTLPSATLPMPPVQRPRAGRAEPMATLPVKAGPAPAERPPRCPSPETLHPALWLGHQLGRHAAQAVATGFPVLDVQLPGGGWPKRALTELLLPHPGVGEIRLMGACLVALQKAGRLVMLFDPPALLSAWGLTQLGLDVAQLLVIHTRCTAVAGSDTLWAAEQALKSGHVGAVLAWLPPGVRHERLRRLQLAAQAHDGPAFVLRDRAARLHPTPAPLRLMLQPGGADMLSLQVLKRRGPPLETPLSLALPPVLSPAGRARARTAVTASPVDEALRGATFVNLAA